MENVLRRLVFRGVTCFRAKIHLTRTLFEHVRASCSRMKHARKMSTASQISKSEEEAIVLSSKLATNFDLMTVPPRNFVFVITSKPGRLFKYVCGSCRRTKHARKMSGSWTSKSEEKAFLPVSNVQTNFALGLRRILRRADYISAPLSASRGPNGI